MLRNLVSSNFSNLLKTFPPLERDFLLFVMTKTENVGFPSTPLINMPSRSTISRQKTHIIVSM